MPIIQISPIALVDSVEKSLIDINPNEDLTLDFSNVEFVPQELLIYLISFISKRVSNDQHTHIKYYSNEKIRAFFDSTRFFYALREVCKLSISDVVIDLPHNFNEERYYSIEPDSSKIERWAEIGFYPITSLPFSNDNDKSYTLKEEPKKWTEGKSIISVIQRNLPSGTVGDKISRHIIYESITNSIRHPKSQNFVITSRRQGDYFTLIIWDNGDSIIDTLLYELKQGKSIKGKDYSDDDSLHSCFCIEKSKQSGRPVPENFYYIFSDDIPDLNEKDPLYAYRKEQWFVLLASLFPGITRDPFGKDYINNIDFISCDYTQKMGGRGLTYLIDTAVRIFGGEVRIRTNKFFMNIKKASNDKKTLPNIFFKKFKEQYYVIDNRDLYEDERISPNGKKIISCLYSAKINTLPERFDAFNGNMITIHIPQK